MAILHEVPQYRQDFQCCQLFQRLNRRPLLPEKVRALQKYIQVHFFTFNPFPKDADSIASDHMHVDLTLIIWIN
jgi:hypothetical protein